MVDIRNHTKPRVSVKTLAIYQELLDYFLESEVLVWQGKRADIAREIRKKLLIAKAYDFNFLVLKFSLFLSAYYSANLMDRKAAKKYRALAQKYRELCYIEDQLNIEYYSLMYKLNNTKSRLAPLKQELDEFCSKNHKYTELGNASINLFIYPMLIAQAFLEANYDRIVSLCTFMVKDLQLKKIERTAPYYKDAAVALMMKGDLETASNHIVLAMSSVTKGKGNWLGFAYYQIMIAIHRQQYKEAYRFFLKHDNYWISSQQLKEDWLILKGFLSFLTSRRLFEGGKVFRIKKLLRSTPIADMDKSGNNINIILLQMLLEGTDWIIDKEDAIRQYMLRHMKTNELKRAKSLMLFLINHAKHSFHLEALKRHAIPHLEKLKSMKLNKQNFDLEIIPYDRIAEIVLTK